MVNTPCADGLKSFCSRRKAHWRPVLPVAAERWRVLEKHRQRSHYRDQLLPPPQRGHQNLQHTIRVRVNSTHVEHISRPDGGWSRLSDSPRSMVSLDFNRMRVLNKNLLVRRLDDGRSKWIWYCMLSNTWKNYGSAVDPTVFLWGGEKKGFLCANTKWFTYKQDARGNRSPPSEAIEKSFQANPSGSFIFSIDDKRYEINFRGGLYCTSGKCSMWLFSIRILVLPFSGMKQVGKKRRAVRRRPVYQPKQQGAGWEMNFLKRLGLPVSL